MKMNDLETARHNQIKSIRTVEVIIKYGGGVRGGKAIMKQIGIDCGSCRLPIKPFSVDEYEKLRGDLDAIKFFLNSENNKEEMTVKVYCWGKLLYFLSIPPI